MRTKAFLYVILTAVALAGVLPASADDRRGRGDHPARRMWEELNLSADQEARFREINARHAPGRREHARQIEELRKRINQELLKDRPSRGLLAQLAGQMGETQKKMNIASVNHFLDVKAVLTPEQFQKFTEMASVGSGVGGRRRGAESRGDADDESEDD
jgi:Spy/CpxP family protein refolding chaperone